MNRKNTMKALLTLFVAFFAVVLFVISMPMANACPVSQASGTFFMSGPPPPPVIKNIGNNIQIVILSDGPFTWTGDISGTGLYNGYALAFNSNSPNMISYGVETWAISATVNGKAGTLEIGGTTVMTLSSANGYWWIISGTGGLAKLHGGGTFQSIDVLMGTYTYTGQIYFSR